MVDVRQPDAGLTSATIPILVGFSNPTSRVLSSIAGDLDVFLNGTRIASEDVAIARLGTGEESIKELSVVAEYADVGASLVDSIRSGAFDVTIEGALHADGRSVEFTAGEESG